jgi:plasminogen activator
MNLSHVQKHCGITATAFFLAVGSQSALAAGEPVKSASTTTQIQVNNHVTVISGRMSLGYLTGESNELVYDPGTGAKISELNWKIDNVLMLGLGGSIQPKRWLRLNADVRFKLGDGDNTMDDYDWLATGYPWTHWSHHDDTDLNTGYTWDLNVEFPFYLAREAMISAFIGYKRDNWEWTAKGGNFVYSYYDFRDTTGTFPAGEKGITYEQWFDTPYIGVGFDTSFANNLQLYGKFIYSTFVQAGDKDQHHMRNLVFEEEFDDGDMYGIDLALAWNFRPKWAAIASFNYQKYDEMKGTTDITDLVTGERYHISGDAAGADHNHTVWSLGVRYTF